MIVEAQDHVWVMNFLVTESQGNARQQVKFLAPPLFLQCHQDSPRRFHLEALSNTSYIAYLQIP